MALSDDLVSVHDPVEGNPVNCTLPVGTEQVGCVIVPTVGAAGVEGCALIVMPVDAGDIHPDELVTVYVYIPTGKPESAVLVPEPVEVALSVDLVSVQVPVAGKPLKTTLPVATAHVGCVIVPTVGDVGVAGWELITTLADATEVPPDALVTV